MATSHVWKAFFPDPLQLTASAYEDDVDTRLSFLLQDEECHDAAFPEVGPAAVRVLENIEEYNNMLYEEDSQGANPIKNVVNGVVGAFETVSDFLYERPCPPSPERRTKNSKRKKKPPRVVYRESRTFSSDSQDDNEDYIRKGKNREHSGRARREVAHTRKQLSDQTRKLMAKKKRTATLPKKDRGQQGESRDDGCVRERFEHQHLDHMLNPVVKNSLNPKNLDESLELLLFQDNLEAINAARLETAYQSMLHPDDNGTLNPAMLTASAKRVVQRHNRYGFNLVGLEPHYKYDMPQEQREPAAQSADLPNQTSGHSSHHQTKLDHKEPQEELEVLVRDNAQKAPDQPKKAADLTYPMDQEKKVIEEDRETLGTERVQKRHDKQIHGSNHSYQLEQKEKAPVGPQGEFGPANGCEDVGYPKQSQIHGGRVRKKPEPTTFKESKEVIGLQTANKLLGERNGDEDSDSKPIEALSRPQQWEMQAHKRKHHTSKRNEDYTGNPSIRKLETQFDKLLSTSKWQDEYGALQSFWARNDTVISELLASKKISEILRALPAASVIRDNFLQARKASDEHPKSPPVPGLYVSGDVTPEKQPPFVSEDKNTPTIEEKRRQSLITLRCKLERLRSKYSGKEDSPQLNIPLEVVTKKKKKYKAPKRPTKRAAMAPSGGTSRNHKSRHKKDGKLTALAIALSLTRLDTNEQDLPDQLEQLGLDLGIQSNMQTERDRDSGRKETCDMERESTELPQSGNLNDEQRQELDEQASNGSRGSNGASGFDASGMVPSDQNPPSALSQTMYVSSPSSQSEENQVEVTKKEARMRRRRRAKALSMRRDLERKRTISSETKQSRKSELRSLKSRSHFMESENGYGESERGIPWTQGGARYESWTNAASFGEGAATDQRQSMLSEDKTREEAIRKSQVTDILSADQVSTGYSRSSAQLSGQADIEFTDFISRLRGNTVERIVKQPDDALSKPSHAQPVGQAEDEDISLIGSDASVAPSKNREPKKSLTVVSGSATMSSSGLMYRSKYEIKNDTSLRDASKLKRSGAGLYPPPKSPLQQARHAKGSVRKEYSSLRSSTPSTELSRKYPTPQRKKMKDGFGSSYARATHHDQDISVAATEAAIYNGGQDKPHANGEEREMHEVDRGQVPFPEIVITR